MRRKDLGTLNCSRERLTVNVHSPDVRSLLTWMYQPHPRLSAHEISEAQCEDRTRPALINRFLHVSWWRGSGGLRRVS